MLLALLAAIGLVVVLIHFSFQSRKTDDVWRRRRIRRAERQAHPRPDEPIDPNFQFDQPNSDEPK